MTFNLFVCNYVIKKSSTSIVMNNQLQEYFEVLQMSAILNSPWFLGMELEIYLVFIYNDLVI